MFDGAAALQSAWRAGIKPEPLMTVSEWTDVHRMLPSKGSAEPGPWRTDRTPYLKEIMDCRSAVNPARRVVSMKGAQVRAPLAIDMPIPTAEGWALMDSLTVGDTLFDEIGAPCRVTGSSPIMIGRPCFAVNFDDDTRSVCDGEHQCPVWDFTDGENQKPRVMRIDTMLGRVRIGKSRHTS